MPNSLDLSSTCMKTDKSVCLSTIFNAFDDLDTNMNISDISINVNEVNSSTPKIQFNIGDSANHPVASATPLESEIDSGFISSEAVVPELSKGLIDIPNNVKFADEDEMKEVSKYCCVLFYIKYNLFI